MPPTTPQSSNKNSVSVPLAIIVAGAMIAAAVFFGGSEIKFPGTSSNPNTNNDVKVESIKADDHILGSANAEVIVVEYSDLECPFCKVFHNTMHQIIDEYQGEVAWVYRHMPIEQLHSRAKKEAEASECAAEQGGNTIFWKYIDQVFATTKGNDSLDPSELPKIASDLGLDVETFNNCLNEGKFTQKIETSIQTALESGIPQGTPYSAIVVKTALSSDKKESLGNIAKSKGYRPDVIEVSSDGKTVLVGGALPIEIMREILDITLE